MERKKRLLLDVEEVIFFGGFLKAVNDFLGTSYVIDDFKDYYIDEAAIPPERMDEFNQFLRGRNLYENPDVLPYALEMVKILCDYYEVLLCTDSINPFDVDNSAQNLFDKFNVLKGLLPFIDPKNFIFTGNKKVFKADIMIDDSLSKLVGNDIELKILFPSYHNKEIPEEELKNAGVIRAGMDWREGWKEVGKILIPDNSFVKKL